MWYDVQKIDREFPSEDFIVTFTDDRTVRVTRADLMDYAAPAYVPVLDAVRERGRWNASQSDAFKFGAGWLEMYESEYERLTEANRSSG